jgi:hypothetical protein
LKYDKDGGAPVLGPLYHNLYGNEFVPDRCWGGVVDQEGNIIAVGAVGIYGVSGGITNDYDWHVRKYNSAGTLVWDDTYAGAANLFDYAFAVDVDSNGDVFVAGYTNIGTDNSTNQDYDWLVIKYDKDTGARLQTKTLRSGPGKSEAAYGLKVDFDDNVIVCGTKQAASGDSNRAIVRLRGTDLGIMDAQWWNSSDAEYCYKVDHNYGRIAIAERTNNGADWDMQATTLFQEFNNLRLEMPADGSTLTDPPTLKWNPDGGESNAYSIEVAFKPGGPWRSTASNLGIIIWDNSWTCPTNVWNRIPTGVTTYWRVVGRDTKVTPPVYITSSETWTFVKN